MNKKVNSKVSITKKRIAYSIIGMIALLVLFLCIEVLRNVVYGVFGYAIYAYLPALLVSAIMILLGKKPNVSLQRGIVYVALFVMVVVTLHIGLSKEIMEGSSFLLNTFEYNTVGGIVVDVLAGLFRLICTGSYAISFAVTFVITAILGLVAIYPLLLDLKGKKTPETRSKQSEIKSPRVNKMFKNAEGDYVEREMPETNVFEEKETGYDSVVNVSGYTGELFSSLTSDQDVYRSKADRSASILFGDGNVQNEYEPSIRKIEPNKYTTLNTLGTGRGLSDFKYDQERKRTVEQSLRQLSPEEEYNVRYGAQNNTIEKERPVVPFNSNTQYVAPAQFEMSDPNPLPYQKASEVTNVENESVAPKKVVLDRASALDFINTPLSAEELVNMDFSRPVKKDNTDYSYMFDDNYSIKTNEEYSYEPEPEIPTSSAVLEKEELVTPIYSAPIQQQPQLIYRDDEPVQPQFENKNNFVEVESKIEEPVRIVEEPKIQQPQHKQPTPVQEKFNIPVKQPKPVYTSHVMAKEKAPVFPTEKKEEVKKPYVPKPYKVPSFDLLNTYAESDNDFPEDYDIVSEKLNQTMQEFDVPAQVFDAKRGPTFTMYYLRVGQGYKLSRIASIKENLKMRLCVKNLRIHAPVEGQDALGIELPNSTRETVGLKSILCSPAFNKDSKGLKIAMGKTLEGEPYVADITKMPHLLVAGSTGTGKSVFLNAVLTSLIYKYSPEELRMVLIDPKKVELTVYRNLPNLLIKEPVKEAKHAVNALSWLCKEMDRRYDVFSTIGCANIDQYNEIARKNNEAPMYRILLVIDEMADLMMNSKDSSVESNIVRIAQLARACGIHMIIATQRPTVKVITGLIKSNIIHRVAFTVKTNMDSRVILDDGGAEELLGLGDMLYSNSNGLVRMQGAFVDISEIKAICDYIREHNECDFDDTIAKAVSYEPPKPETVEERSAQREEERDAEFENQLQIILKSFIATGRASVSSAQASHHVGYIKARKLVDAMTERGFLSPGEGAKPRDILITMDEWEELFGEKSIAQEFADQDYNEDDED